MKRAGQPRYSLAHAIAANAPITKVDTSAQAAVRAQWKHVQRDYSYHRQLAWENLKHARHGIERHQEPHYNSRGPGLRLHTFSKFYCAPRIQSNASLLTTYGILVGSPP